MRIVWDPVKSASNLRKHDVSFEEAAKLLARERGFLEFYDDFHSVFEDRFIAIGWVGRRLVLVVYTEPDDNEWRIISARLATKAERDLYEAYEKEVHGE